MKIMSKKDGEILSDAHKCLEYANNYNHDCPEELRKKFNCKHHEKIKKQKEDKGMTTKTKRQKELSSDILKALKTGEEVKGISDREFAILKGYYIDDLTYKQVAQRVGMSRGHIYKLKKEAVDKINDNDDCKVSVECSDEICTRTKKFKKTKKQDEWYCWQHEKDDSATETEVGLEKTELVEENEGVGTMENTKYVLAMIEDGEAKTIQSEDEDCIKLAAEAIKESNDFDEIILGKSI